MPSQHDAPESQESIGISNGKLSDEQAEQRSLPPRGTAKGPKGDPTAPPKGARRERHDAAADEPGKTPGAAEGEGGPTDENLSR
jgi:hypothetical protein